MKIIQHIVESVDEPSGPASTNSTSTSDPSLSNNLVVVNLRPLTAASPTCPRGDKVMVIKIIKNGKAIYLHKPLPCFLWSCTVGCVALKARLLGRRILGACQEYGLKTSVVLTIRRSSSTVTASLHYIRQCLSRFHRKVKRHFKGTGIEASYIAVADFHQSGYAHLNLFVNYWLCPDTIRTYWVESGGGTRCSISPLDTDADIKKSIQYATKPEKLTSPPFPHRAIRCTRSKTIQFRKRVEPSTTTIQEVSMDATLSFAKFLGLPVKTQTRGSEILSLTTATSVWPSPARRSKRHSETRKVRKRRKRQPNKKRSPLGRNEPAQACSKSL